MTRLAEVRSKNTNSQLEPQITNLQVKGRDIIIFLNDGRTITTPINLLTKWGVLDHDVKTEQLKEYELRNEGKIIYFPIIDDVLPTRKLIKGLFTC